MRTHGIMRPLPMAIAGTGFSLPQRVASEEPKEVAVALGGAASITLDLLGVTNIDTIFVGFTNDAGAGQLRWSYGVAGPTETIVENLAPAPTKQIAARRHFFRTLEAPIAARYVQIYSPNLTAGYEIGVIAIGKAFKPALGPEIGQGRGVIDTGSATRRLDGGFGIVRGARAGTWQWTLGDLTDDERDELYGLILDRGETASVLVFEDLEIGGALGDKLHWSLLQRNEAYERRDPNLNRWALKLQDWA